MANSIVQPPPAPTLCRQCGAPLARQSVVCRECGCVPLIEESSAAVTSAFGTAKFHAKRIGRTLITSRFALLWLLAIIPFVMVTPIAVIAYCALMLLRPRSGVTAGELAHLGIIAAVALVNLKLSYDFSQDAIYWLTNWLGQWRDWFLNIRQPQGNPNLRSA